MTLAEFEAAIQTCFMKSFHLTSSSESLYFIIRRVYSRLKDSGVIISFEDQEDSGWVITQPNWLTREVLGRLAKASNEVRLQQTALVHGHIFTTSQLASTFRDVVTAFSGNEAVLAKMLVCAGACAAITNFGTDRQSESTQSTQYYFPILASNSIQGYEPLNLNATPELSRNSRIIVRRYELAATAGEVFEAFHDGYFQRLALDVISIVLFPAPQINDRVFLFIDGFVVSQSRGTSVVEVRLIRDSSRQFFTCEVRMTSTIPLLPETLAWKLTMKLSELIMNPDSQVLESTLERLPGQRAIAIQSLSRSVFKFKLFEFGVDPKSQNFIPISNATDQSEKDSSVGWYYYGGRGDFASVESQYFSECSSSKTFESAYNDSGNTSRYHDFLK
jgi:hypothetical protein